MFMVGDKRRDDWYWIWSRESAGEVWWYRATPPDNVQWEIASGEAGGVGAWWWVALRWNQERWRIFEFFSDEEALEAYTNLTQLYHVRGSHTYDYFIGCVRMLRDYERRSDAKHWPTGR